MDAVGFGLVTLGAVLVYSAVRGLHPWDAFWNSVTPGHKPQVAGGLGSGASQEPATPGPSPENADRSGPNAGLGALPLNTVEYPGGPRVGG